DLATLDSLAAKLDATAILVLAPAARAAQLRLYSRTSRAVGRLTSVSIDAGDAAVKEAVSRAFGDAKEEVVAAVGPSGPVAPFDPSQGGSVDLQLTRVAPLGTVLLDLWAEPAFAAAAGTLDVVVLAGATPVGSREMTWPGEAPEKRPLRISGLTGIGLRILFE